MSNQIHFITNQQDLPKENKNNLIVTIDGEELDTFEKFIDYMENEFHFPETCLHMFDRFMDWIRDLTWFDYTRYTVVIKSYSCFMSKSDYSLKCLVMDAFQNEILPFWEKDVSKYVVGGVPRSFNVYLLESKDKGTVKRQGDGSFVFNTP